MGTFIFKIDTNDILLEKKGIVWSHLIGTLNAFNSKVASIAHI